MIIHRGESVLRKDEVKVKPELYSSFKKKSELQKEFRGFGKTRQDTSGSIMNNDMTGIEL